MTKTPEEWANMSREEQREHLASEEKIVFGHDVTHKKGEPVQHGIGAPGRETHNHYAALRKHEGEDAYWEAVAAKWKADAKHAAKLGLPKPRPAPTKVA